LLLSSCGCIFLVDTCKEALMRVRVQKWGNSLALRIPKSFATETALDSGAEVDLTLEEGRLVVTPRRAPSYELSELLTHISPENLHREVDTGPSVGSEAW
jgi:antitoxin MazE